MTQPRPHPLEIRDGSVFADGCLVPFTEPVLSAEQDGDVILIVVSPATREHNLIGIDRDGRVLWNAWFAPDEGEFSNLYRRDGELMVGTTHGWECRVVNSLTGAVEKHAWLK